MGFKKKLDRELEELESVFPGALDACATAAAQSKALDILINDTHIHDLIEKIWEAILAWEDNLQEAGKPRLFRGLGNELVTIRRDGQNEDRLSICRVTVPEFRRIIHERCRFFTMTCDEDGKPTRKVAQRLPDQQIPQMMLAEVPDALPWLSQIIFAPVYDGDLDLQTEGGYNVEIGCYYYPRGQMADLAHNYKPAEELFPPDGEVAHRMMLEAKAYLLSEWWRDFPFATEADRANAMAFLLTFFLASRINDPVPFFVVEAAREGAGKSLLSHLIFRLGTGRGPKIMLPGTINDGPECQRRVFAGLASGERFFFIDNVEQIKSTVLASILTPYGGTVSDRVIGTSTQATVNARAIWAATGNNPQFSPELSRRIVPIRLNWQPTPAVYHRPDISAWTEQQCGRLTHNALVLIEYWKYRGGCTSKSAPLASYENWHRYVGGVMEAIEMPEFLQNRDEFLERATDDVWEDDVFIRTWWDRFEGNPVTATMLLQDIIQDDDCEIYGDILEAGRTVKGQVRALGHRLGKLLDRPIGKLVVRRTNGTKRRYFLKHFK